MKKILLVLVTLLGFVAVSSAQSKSLGLRFGAFDSEISYEHYAKGADFMEFELGAHYRYGYAGFRATGIYNWMIAQPNWTRRGEWGFYGGIGGSLGAVPYEQDDDHYVHSFYAAFVAQIGLEYTFWFPLQLAFDMRPAIGLVGGHFSTSYLGEGFVPTLSVRYSF